MIKLRPTFCCLALLLISMGTIQWTGHVWCQDRGGRVALERIPCCIAYETTSDTAIWNDILLARKNKCIGCLDLDSQFVRPGHIAKISFRTFRNKFKSVSSSDSPSAIFLANCPPGYLHLLNSAQKSTSVLLKTSVCII